MHVPAATIDFETRSKCSLKASGSWKYSLDPSTEPLCLAFRLPIWPEGQTGLWHPTFPHIGIVDEGELDLLYELLDWIDEGGLVEAQNAFFERGIWTNIMAPRYGWPRIPHRLWRCSAAKAAAFALPRGLADVVAALRLQLEKDEKGHKLMQRMTKPRKALKKEWEAWALHHEDDPMDTLWHETPEQLERLWDYCRVDVLAEEQVSLTVPDLTEEETEIYLLDQAINERGFGLDRAAIDTALALIDAETIKLNDELAVLTDGAVKKASQKARMKEWFECNGLVLENMQGPTIDAAGAVEGLEPTTKRALEIVRTLGRSSTAKYGKMRNWICPDNRAHGGLLYHGASTGRWTGAGIQPQNFPRGTIKKFDGEWAWEQMKAGAIEKVLTKYA